MHVDPMYTRYMPENELQLKRMELLEHWAWPLTLPFYANVVFAFETLLVRLFRENG